MPRSPPSDDGTVRILLVITLGICDAITVNVQLGSMMGLWNTTFGGFFTDPLASERARWKLFFKINCHIMESGF